jgi:hypothetical protein
MVFTDFSWRLLKVKKAEKAAKNGLGAAGSFCYSARLAKSGDQHFGH